jgi:hypothetical protein
MIMELIGSYFISHVLSIFYASDPPSPEPLVLSSSLNENKTQRKKMKLQKIQNKREFRHKK